MKKRTSKKKKPYQTGRSNKAADRMRKAKKPGKRKSSSGGKYIERRKNRSDMPHSLTGADRKLEGAVKKVEYINKQIIELQKKIRETKNTVVKDTYRSIIRIRKKQLRGLKQFIRKQK